MTTEEKAKAYDEALERAKKFHTPDSNNSNLKAILGIIFPELAESEDGRARQRLINIVKTMKWSTADELEEKYQLLTYLERQKESSKNVNSIPADCVSNAKCPYKIHGEGEFVGDIRDTPAYWRGWDDAMKQKEQNPVVEVLAKAGLKPYRDGNQWCILAGDNIQEGICGLGDTIDDALYHFLLEIIEKQKEQEEITMPNSTELIEMWEKEEAILKERDLRGDTWRIAQSAFMDGFAKGCGVRQKEQKPVEDAKGELPGYQSDGAPLNDSRFVEGFELGREVQAIFDEPSPVEWSEEDKKMLLSIINAFRNGTVSTIGQEHWLKSLPQRFNLQPKQEWSEEDEVERDSIMVLIGMPNIITMKMKIFILLPIPHVILMRKPAEKQ